MKYNLKTTVILFTSLFLGTLTSFSQVTIGSNKPTEKGALLELTNAVDDTGMSTKGMMLPRVKITSLGEMLETVDPSEHLMHTGLVVYSVDENFCDIDFIYRGPYVWSGNRWSYLGPQEKQSSDVHVFVDPRDNVNYRYRNFGPLAGTWMIDDMRAFEYDGPGTPPDLNAAAQSSPFTSKQFAYPGPNGDGYNNVYFLKQPAIGILYSWAAAINVEPGVGIDNPGTTDEGETGINSSVVRQGICPQGWHVPSDKEWSDLESAIAQAPEQYSTNSGTTWDDAWRLVTGYNRGTHSTSMKSHCQPIAFSGTESSNGKSFLPQAGGFNVLLVGDLYEDRVQNFGNQVSFWSSNARDSGAAWNRRFNAEEERVARYNNDRSRLYSVRCKMD